MHPLKKMCAGAILRLAACLILWVWLVAPAGANAAETAPPVTTPSPIMGTYVTSQNVTLTCSDGSGSGCASTYYCLGAGCTPATPYSGPVSIASSTSLSFYSTDQDGNSEQVRTYAYTIDPALAYRFERLWPQLEQPWYFDSPSGMARDSAGNLYVADSNYHRIQKFDANGVFVTSWGGKGFGNGQFSRPEGVAIGPDGSVYVADTFNNRIQKFTANGAFVAAWGSPGSGNGQFSNPRGVAVDGSGTIYVTDTGNNRLQTFDSGRSFLAVWGSSGSGNGQFNYPYGVAVDPAGSVYVADYNNHRVQKFDANGIFVTAIGTGSGDGQLAYPLGVVTDGNGNLYVVDGNKHRIQKFTAAGNFVGRWGDGEVNAPYYGIVVDENGTTSVTDANNNRLQRYDSGGTLLSSWGPKGSGPGQFNTPTAVAVGPAGNIYVADTTNNRIQVFDAAGAPVNSWGSGGTGTGQFNAPVALAVEPGGAVYVSDSVNNRVQKFAANGSFLTAWGSNGTGSGQFSSPDGIAVNSAGDVYVVDRQNNRIQKFTSGGVFVTSWGVTGSGNGQFSYPKGVAIDGADNLYVVDRSNNRVQKFTSGGTFVTSWGGFGSGNGQFMYPEQIAIDRAGMVYVSDYMNYRIQKFTASGTFVAAWGGFGSGAGQFNKHCAIALDSTNAVYIADTDNHRIQKFVPLFLPDPPTGVTAIAGVGQATVSFTPPVATGGSPILSYTVTSNPGTVTASGTASPVTVTGLTGGTAYTFTVTATNASGTSQSSAASNSVTPTVPTFLLSLGVSGSGTVHSVPAPDINCTGSCGQSYPVGTVVTLTATPGSGYAFSGWSGACSGTGSCIVAMSQARSVTAAFTLPMVDGSCGGASGGTYALAPVANLCTIGLPSGVTGIGPWFWSCAGSNGGAPASCSASQAGGIVHRSGDAGQSWTPGTTGLGFNDPPNALLPSPTYASDHTLFLGANSGIYRSSDSGDSWTQVNAAYSVRAFAASPAYAVDHTLFAGAFTTGVHKSTDSGATWTQTNTGLGTTMVFSLAISPAYASDRTVFAGMYGQGVYRSSDGGATWNAANTGIETVHAKSLAISPTFATDRTIFVATSNNLVYRSTDAGATWALANNGLPWAERLAISPAYASDQTLFAAGSGGIYKSVDRGNSWLKVSSISAVNGLVLSPAYASDQAVLVSVFGDTVYRSSSGGSSWSPATSAFTVGNRELMTLALSPAYASDRTVFTATSLIGPYSRVSPLSLAFGTVAAGSSSTSRQVTIANGDGMFGDANLAISGMTLTGSDAGQFAIAPGSCGSLTPVLPVGASCSVDITFTPASAGSKSATLTVSHNDPSRSAWTIGLTGSGSATVSSTITAPAANSATNGTTVVVSGIATSAGDTVAKVEVSADGGTTWQTASGTTSWSIVMPTSQAGSYTFTSRATTSGGMVETPGTGVTVLVDRTAPTGTLALYFGAWTLNASAQDGGMCLMVYPSICGTVEMSLDGSFWQPATTTPGSGGLLWLRDRAGNVSSVSGVVWNSNGGPIRMAGSSSLYYSSLQPAYDTAQNGDIIKLTQAPWSENLVLARSGAITIRGGYDSSHGAVTGTTTLTGALTVQSGNPCVENLEVTGNVAIEGGTMTASALTIL